MDIGILVMLVGTDIRVGRTDSHRANLMDWSTCKKGTFNGSRRDQAPKRKNESRISSRRRDSEIAISTTEVTYQHGSTTSTPDEVEVEIT